MPPTGIGNQVDVFNKYPGGIYWKDLPENEQWDKDGKCVYCWNKAHIGECHYCHEVIHGAAFYATLLEGREVYFHSDCHNDWVDQKINDNANRKTVAKS